MDIFSVLQIIFIVLKVLELIDWSWWLVFTPMYCWFIITLIFVALYDGGSSLTLWLRRFKR
jgi:hypothetical protein